MTIKIPERDDGWPDLLDDLRDLTAKGLSGVFSLIDRPGFRAMRDSRDFSDPAQAPLKPQGDFPRPTATAHALLTMVDLGVEYASSPRTKSDSDLLSPVEKSTLSGIRTHTNPEHDPPRLPSYEVFLQHFLLTGETQEHDIISYFESLNSRDQSGREQWAIRLLGSSGHSSWKLTPSPLGTPSETISIAHLLHAVQSILDRTELQTWDKYRPVLDDGCIWLIRRLISIIDNAEKWLLELKTSGDDSQVLEIPAYLLYLCSSGLRAAAALSKRLEKFTNRPETDRKIGDRRRLVAHWADRQLHRMMARRSVPGDTEFDAATLAFALRARQLANAKRLHHSFMLECLKQIAETQLPNGCWPDCVATDMEGWKTPLQPSAELALCLSALPFTRRFLISPSREDVALARLALKPLLRFAAYLDQTFIDFVDEDGAIPSCAYGWSSDRIRSRRRTEIWPTALSTRTLHLTYLLAAGCSRARVIDQYNGRYPSAFRGRMALDQFSDQKETDQIAKPIGTIRKGFLEPLEAQSKRGKYFVKTDDNAASFILFGPPGSGKTHLLTSIRDALEWPLIEFNPGDFTHHGSERFEETASTIFKDLMGLFHAIVLFDECDELFRARPGSKDTLERNLFSFVTASMLPKLQRLHDDGEILFVVATNHVSSIDEAVRRQGRFDEIVLLDRFDASCRERVIQDLAKERPMTKDEAHQLAQSTVGLTYREIERAVGLGSSEREEFLKRAADLRKDYLEWWCKNGEKECAAARLADKFDGIKTRLSGEIPEYTYESVGEESGGVDKLG